MGRAVEVASSGELGELRFVEAWMQVPLLKRADIRYEHDLGGGAGMDLGAYTTHQVRTLLGAEPTVTAAKAKERSSGVDRWMRAELAFPYGRGRAHDGVALRRRAPAARASTSSARRAC